MNEVTEEMKKNAVDSGWSPEQVEKGYGIFSDGNVGNGATRIERIEGVMKFKSDEEAAQYAEETDGIKLIHDIHFEPGDRNFAYYVDTPENRELLYNLISRNVVVKVSNLAKYQFEQSFMMDEVRKAFAPIGIMLSDRQIENLTLKELTDQIDYHFGKRPRPEYHYDKQEMECQVGDVFHNTNGSDYRVLEKYSETNILFMNVDTGAMLVGVGVEFFRKLPKPTKEELEKAKKLIDEFCIREFGQGADFSDYSNVALAYSEESIDPDGETVISVEVSVDLINYELRVTANGVTVELYQYDTLDDLIEYELDFLDYDSLISLSDESIAIAKGEKDLETDRKEICIEWGHGIYLSNKPSEIDFTGLKREYGRGMEPNERGEFDIEVRKVLARTESVKAGYLGDAIDELMNKFKRGELEFKPDDFKGMEYIPIEKGR